MGVDRSMYGEKQQSVLNKAEKQLQCHSWFKKLCLDNLPCESRLCNQSSIEAAITQLVKDTIYFDAPIDFEMK